MNDDKIIVTFTKDEYSYLVGFISATFDSMKKLPKKMRGKGFSIIESLVNNQFNIVSSNGKTNLN